jgi:hypothetical protein
MILVACKSDAHPAARSRAGMSDTGVIMAGMRPALKPGLIAVWRNRDTLQIGVDPRRAIALTGMREVAGLLGLLDGSRDHSQVLAAAGELGIGPAAADRVIALLAAGGALADLPAGSHRELPVALRARLAPELATAALAHGDGDGGARTLARRRAACVRVHGTSRAGLCVASLLSAAGIGLVISTGPAVRGAVEPETPAAPAGGTSPRPAPPGAGHQQVTPPGGPPVPAALHPAHRLTGTGRPPGARSRSRAGVRRPDLVIIADSYARELPGALTRDGVAHLATSAGEAIGVVGPLVVPGYSACLRCMDLIRAERDPAWPLILAQLSGRAAEPAACDAVLAAAVGAQAAAQALAFIDRGAWAAAAVGGTLELVLPGWQWRRRSWPRHRRCGCGTGHLR